MNMNALSGVYDAGQAGADRLDHGLRVHVDGADLVTH